MVMVFIIIWYFLMQMIRLYEYGEPSIMVTVRDSYFDSDFELNTEEQGFMVAFGLSAFDDETEDIEDYSYGRLKGVYKSWGHEDSQGIETKEIPFLQCTRAQLGLPQLSDNLDSDYSQPSLFYSVHSSSQNDLDYYYRKLRCVDSEFLRIQGDYNSAKARHF